MLELDKEVGGTSPVGAILESFCFLAECYFLCKILVLLFLDSFIVLSLCLEESITESAETLEERIVDFLVGKAELAPFLLNLEHSLSLFLPILDSADSSNLNSLKLLTESYLSLFVGSFCSLQ